MVKTTHKWKCPEKNVFLLKAETILLAIMVFLVFIFSFAVFSQQWLPTIISTIFFLGVFLGIYYLSKKIYPMEEHYHLTDKSIKITSKTKNKTEKTEIKYKDIKNFKIDKLFHGGRIETKNKRHPIYFNHKKEIHKFEKILKKKVKS